jgi:hypothetical protein
MFTINDGWGRAMINGLGQVKVFSSEAEAEAYIAGTVFENLTVEAVHLVK